MFSRSPRPGEMGRQGDGAMRQRGFSLIELMVVVAILAILATIVVPAYERYVRSARRADGRSAVTAVALAQERAFSVYQKYCSLASLETLAGLEAALAGGRSVKNSYAVSVTTTSTGFTVTAARDPADADPECVTMTLTSAGVKGGTYDAGKAKEMKCWQ